MAEVLATMVVGPLVSMVKDKASSYLLDQYKVMEGMEEQHKLLKRKLPAVLDVITDAEEQAAKNREGAKAWLEELRMVAYKANDVLDEFKYEALRRKAKEEGHYKEFGMDVIKLFPSHNRFVFRYRMANKLRMILQEIDVLIAEMNTFRFKFKPQPPMSLKWRQTDHNISDNSLSSIASDSRAEEKGEIVAKLCGQGENMGLTVLPIVGMGGMGKTTLAQLVYNDPDIQKHFQLRLWVCVSENFDVNFLAERIVEEANKENGRQAEGTTALEKLQNAVSGKRYLLVLDDVWNREAYKWENLRSYLHHGLPGSSVVTTTRDKNIADFMGTIKDHENEIKGLDLSSIENIIKARAFGSQAQRPELLEMVSKVSERCSGSPLAATTLGSVLRTKNTVQEWEVVLSRNTICDEENGILPILKLSYNCLPAHMRQCFAFCAMFPKDHEIDVEMLIQLWMANSFIPEQQGWCLEVTGKQIFNELAQRSFFQEVKQVRSDGAKYAEREPGYCARTTCKIHDLMHDVAQNSMGNECAAVDTKVNQSKDFPYSARHLFVSVDIPEYRIAPATAFNKRKIPENGPNASAEKGSPSIQTLICEQPSIWELESYARFLIDGLKDCDGSTKDDLQHLLLECRSLRALKTRLSSSPNFDTEDMDLVLARGLARQKRGVCFGRHTFGKKQGHRKSETPATLLVQRHLRRVMGCWLPNKEPRQRRRKTRTRATLSVQPQLRRGTGRRVPNIPSYIEPKYLHHLRYLDLSGSDMKAVPKEITILYHLQTLNLSRCRHLEQLPMVMKHMTALRHLYTDGCPRLKGMPPDLGHLTSLQTLTCFVAGTGSSCSNIGELENLDLGGQLELSHLENVTREDGKAANLGDKRKLEELKLSWDLDTNRDEEAQKVAMAHKEVLEALKPHDGIKALRMFKYGGRAFPTWMLKLQCMVELKLYGCQNLEMLPALWELRELQFLYLIGLTNLACFFSGGAPSKFQKLEVMVLEKMPKFVKWWHTNEVQGEEPIFPKVEHLRIRYCESLEALPKASVIEQPPSRDNTECCRSAFPALREMELCRLEKLHRWEAVEEEHVTFPSLEDLQITGCPKLIDFPEAPKLSTLELDDCSQQASLQAASRYITSLSSMKVFMSSDGANIEQNWKEVKVRGQESPMEVLYLQGCHVFFSDSSAPALWKCFGKLACLEICNCNDLIYWLENLFGGLESLRTLKIQKCPRLTGLITNEQSAAPERSGGPLLPRLESLEIYKCEKLEQVPNLRAPSLKTFRIRKCGLLRSLVLFGEQEDCTRLESGEGVVQPADTSSSLIVPVSTSADNYCFFPCLESLHIIYCPVLSKVAILLPSIKTMKIISCKNLVSLSGEVKSLENLYIYGCESLQSLPNWPYSCLRVLRIEHCKSMKLVLGNLQECLDHHDEKEPDRRHPQVINKTPEEGEIDSELESVSMSDREHHQEQGEIDSKPESMSDEASTAIVWKQSSSTSSNHHVVFPCLEYLKISSCDGVEKVANLPRSMKTLKLMDCTNLVSLSGEFLTSLEKLRIRSCQSLKSLPNGPHQVYYSSLRVLTIEDCPGIKQLPASLQQRLDHLEGKRLDPHLLQVPTGRTAALMNKLACFRSRGREETR